MHVIEEKQREEEKKIRLMREREKYLSNSHLRTIKKKEYVKSLHFEEMLDKE